MNLQKMRLSYLFLTLSVFSFLGILLRCQSPKYENPCSPITKTFWKFYLFNAAINGTKYCNLTIPRNNNSQNSSGIASPTITYNGNPFIFTTGVPITSMTPTLTGNPTSCNSLPSLPTGLTLNTSTCVISGTPTVISNSANYTITATNSAGNGTAPISISVLPAPFYRWRFEGDFTSSTVNTLTGTPSIQGSGPIPTLNTSVFKEGSSSVFFNPGMNAHMNGGFIQLGVFDFGTTFSVSLWVNTSGADAGYTNKLLTILSNKTGGTTSQTNGFAIFINEFNSNNAQLQISTGNGTLASDVKSIANAISFNQWVHITVVVDKTSGKAKLYSNGLPLSLQMTDDIRTDFTTNNTTRIGHISNTFHYQGYMDDFRIYKILLTPAQITDIFNQAL
jgi:hypothetical protein